MNWKIVFVGGLVYYAAMFLVSMVPATSSIRPNGRARETYRATASFWRPELNTDPPDMGALMKMWIPTGLLRRVPRGRRLLGRALVADGPGLAARPQVRRDRRSCSRSSTRSAIAACSTCPTTSGSGGSWARRSCTWSPGRCSARRGETRARAEGLRTMYLWLKLIHILAVVMFIGNIVTGVFWHKHAVRTRDRASSRTPWTACIRSDRLFTMPGVLVILASGDLRGDAGRLSAASHGLDPVDAGDVRQSPASSSWSASRRCTKRMRRPRAGRRASG